jgi:hypothetical protein
MKKIVFICTHQYSGSNELYYAMDKHPRIQGCKSIYGNVYNSAQTIISVCGIRHKLRNKSSIYMDEITYNNQISNNCVFDYCKFIFLIRSPEAVLSEIISNEGIDSIFAVRRYSFRLRRICEFAKKSGDGVLLTYDDLCEAKGINLINDYLELSSPINFDPLLLKSGDKKFNMDLLEPVLRSEVFDSYERYLYFLKSLPLRRPR